MPPINARWSILRLATSRTHPSHTRLRALAAGVLDHVEYWREAVTIGEVAQPFHAIATRPALREQHGIVTLRQEFGRNGATQWR
jgi:hypothetical protein